MFGKDMTLRGLAGRSCLHGGPLMSRAPCPGSVDRLRELRVRGVRGAAHQGDPFLQTGLSHPAVKGKDEFQCRAGCL